MPEIKLTRISADYYESILINSIEDDHPKIRQNSKSPTFMLQFDGTFHGLMRKFGFSKKAAQKIEKAFLTMYAKSKEWTRKRIKKAHDKGFVVGAFNLRLKTPILEQTIYNISHTPNEAKSESRSAGNMISGQSYGLLTLRAFGQFMIKVRNHKKYRLAISPWSSIYDAIYLEIDNDAEQLHWINQNLVRDMVDIKGCEELEHPIVKMETILCLYYPTWADEIKIPNDATLKDIRKLLKETIK